MGIVKVKNVIRLSDAETYQMRDALQLCIDIFQFGIHRHNDPIKVAIVVKELKQLRDKLLANEQPF